MNVQVSAAVILSFYFSFRGIFIGKYGESTRQSNMARGTDKEHCGLFDF